MRSYDLVFDSFIVHFYSMVGIVAPENEKIFHSKLLRFAPAQFEARLLNLVPSFECLSIEHIKDFLVVNLEKRTVNIDSFSTSRALSLRKDFTNRSNCQANIINLGHLYFASSFLSFSFFVLVALHCVCLA